MSEPKYSRVPTEEPESNADNGKDKPSRKSSMEKKGKSEGKVRPSKSNGSTPSSSASKRKSVAVTDDSDAHVKIQFAAPQFFCTEDQNATVRVMRLGALDESCKVRYRTEDGSAKSGVKYTETSGTLKFKEGELSKSIEVPIISSTSFDTVLEFFVQLDADTGCNVCPHLRVCRVMVLDNDTFPETQFKDVVNLHDDDALQEIGVSLLMGYMRLALWSVPGVWWKALLTVLFDQLENVYDLGMVYLRVYLVDVVLNPEVDESTLPVAGDRKGTAMLLAGLYLGPCLILFLIERLKQGPWYMGATLNDSLKVNIFRKYLNFTESSRRAAPIEDLTGAMSGDVADLVENGFMGMFEIVQYCGKILSTGIFVVSKNPMNAVPLALYPLILITYTWCRQARATELQDQCDEADGDVLGTVLGTIRDFDIICDYSMRPGAVDTFEEQLRKSQRADYRARIFTFYNEQLVPMITNFIVAAYICVGSSQVLAGTTTVGAFIATVTIFQTLGTKFDKIYTRMRTWLTAVGPVVGVTHLLSLPTTTRGRMARSKDQNKRQQELLEQLQEKNKDLKSSSDLYNGLPIRLSEVGVAKIKSLKERTVEAPQGKVIAIIGPHASGKSALMKIISHGPEKGSVYMPEHLRCLNVGYNPVVLEDRDLLENVCFGSKMLDESLAEETTTRICNICRRVGFSKKMQSRLEDDLKKREQSRKSRKAKPPADDDEEEEEEQVDDSWCSQLSNSEKRHISLARAFIFDPEVMVLHKPLNDLDQSAVQSVLDLCREFVDNRGLEDDKNSINTRTPRSLFVSVGQVAFCSEELAKVADVVWRLPGTGALDVMPGAHEGSQAANNVNILDMP